MATRAIWARTSTASLTSASGRYRLPLHPARPGAVRRAGRTARGRWSASRRSGQHDRRRRVGQRWLGRLHEGRHAALARQQRRPLRRPVLVRRHRVQLRPAVEDVLLHRDRCAERAVLRHQPRRDESPRATAPTTSTPRKAATASRTSRTRASTTTRSTSRSTSSAGANEDFAGANIYALSKQQLVTTAIRGAVNGVVWTLGNNYYSFRAAAGDPTNTEYLLASEQNDVTQNALDFAQVTGDNKIGKGPVFLSLTSIPSESFTEPVDAQSTGDGTTCVQTLARRDLICSVPETYARPDRHAAGAAAVLERPALHVAGHVADGRQRPDVVDGAAWFQVDPKAVKVVTPGLRRRGGHVPAHAEPRPVRSRTRS